MESSSKISKKEEDAEVDHHANSISLLIEERRRSLEERQIVRKLEWKKSSKEKAEDRGIFENNFADQSDEVWESRFSDPIVDTGRIANALLNMPKLRGRFRPGDRTKLLFSLVLPALDKTETLNLEEAFHCRLVCKSWRKAVDYCLQQACKIEAKRSGTWSELTKYVPRFPTSKEKQQDFLQIFPAEEEVLNPFLMAHCLQIQDTEFQRAPAHASSSILQLAQGIDELGLFVNFWSAPPPLHTLALIENPPLHLKQLAISNIRDHNDSFLHNEDHNKILSRINEASSRLEALAFYEVHERMREPFLKKHRKTLKIIVWKGTTQPQPRRRDPIRILKCGPFPCLETLILESDAHCPDFDDVIRSDSNNAYTKDCLPSLEELEWIYKNCNENDARNVFRFLNVIGGGLRHLRLGFLSRKTRHDDMLTLSNLEPLDLPKLETLELTWPGNVDNLDVFILPLETLKEFNLTLRRCSSSSDQSSSSPIEYKIKFAGYEDRMYESNVWDILPELRKLKITIITQEEKATKVYTRDGFNLFCGRGMDGKIKKSGTQSSFYQAIKENRREDVIQIIRSGGINIYQLANDEDKSSILHLAAWNIPNRDDAIEMLKVLIKAGAKLDAMNGLNCPFTDGLFFVGNNLPKLTSEQFNEFVEFLIDSGHGSFLENTCGKDGSSLLHRAMKEGILSKLMVRVLKFENVNLNCLCSTSENNLLYYAISGNRGIEMIKYLVKVGVDWEELNYSNWNILHAAAHFCNVAAFKYFFALDQWLVFDETNDGLTPLDFLEKYHPGSQDAVDLLKFVERSRTVKMSSIQPKPCAAARKPMIKM